jgi:phosphatidylethanolamine-binding protein (PEBP) family uncharacterized protein
VQTLVDFLETGESIDRFLEVYPYIPAFRSKGLLENVPPQASLPDGTVQGLNGGNVVGYRGPGAPATGPKHHYTLELFALDLGPEKSRRRYDSP